MVSKIPLFVRWAMKLTNFSFDKERVYSIEVNAKNEQLRKQHAADKAQIAKLTSKIDEYEKRDPEEEEHEIENSKKLTEEDKRLRKEEIGNCISLNSFYSWIYGIKIPPNQSDFRYRSKDGKKFKVTDRNEEVQHTFGEILLSDKGYLMITNIKKQILVKVPIPKGLFYKHSSLTNQIKLKRFVLGVDKNQEFVPNWDEIEMPVPVWNEEKYEYEESSVMAKARDLIIEKDTHNRELSNRIEQLEIVLTELKRDYRDLYRSKELYKATANNSSSDLSRAMNIVYEIQKKDYEKSSKIVNLSESNSMKEEESLVLEKSRVELLKKLENDLQKTKQEKARAEIMDAIDYVKTALVNSSIVNK